MKECAHLQSTIYRRNLVGLLLALKIITTTVVGLIDPGMAAASFLSGEGTSPFCFPSFPCTILPRHPDLHHRISVPDDPTPPTVVPYLPHPDVTERLVATAWACLAALADLHPHWIIVGNSLPLPPRVASVASIGAQQSRRKPHASVQFRALLIIVWTETTSIW